jgi:predicted RNA binding protein YcfA (HicA-like mRNA interferase family)
MKKKDVERELHKYGWFLKREGKAHEVWSNGQGKTEMLPRHREIDQSLANKIIKTAQNNPGKE